MAKRPRNKKVDTSIIEQGGVTPIRALTAALMNRRDRKEDRKYQESLKDMGMFEEGGGRANVPSSRDRMYMAPPKDMRKKYGGKVAKMEAGGEVPSKYKGFSKLPESVQRNMDSDLAQKYEYGGEVGGNCRGGGAALRGTKFSGCK
jgi:hypothetical protein